MTTKAKVWGPILALVLIGVTLLWAAIRPAAEPTHPTRTSAPTYARPVPPQRAPAPDPATTTSPRPGSSTPPGKPAGHDDTWDTTVASAPTPVLDAAVTFMTAYARPRPGTPTASWWAAVRAKMTPDTAAYFDGTDPANIPCTRVTGPPLVVDQGTDHSDAIALIGVPTDAGTYIVHLRPTAPYLVTDLTAPRA